MHRDDAWVLASAGNAKTRDPPAVIRELAAEAGISIDGDAPWDIRVFDEPAYQLVLAKGSLGFGESYVEGRWECTHLDQLFHRLLSSKVDEKIDSWSRVRLLCEVLRHSLFNLQSNERAGFFRSRQGQLWQLVLSKQERRSVYRSVR